MIKWKLYNESEELDDWNDDEPKVYKYYSDEPISPNQFVSLVRSMEQSIEDIFIQNSDFYENADDPWEEFVDDMCQGKSPEEAFDLDYYMNSAARKQLPDDITKYVYANDFDAMQWLRGIFERLMPICKDPVGESKRRSEFEVVKNIPTWAENYFLYKDETDLNDVDMKLIFDFVDELKKKGLRLFEPIPGSENEYNDSPAFGYGTSTEDWYARKIVNVGERCNESSRFGFNVGDEVELTSDVEPNRFSDRGVVQAGTVGEIVAVDKPMRGVIKVKIEDGTVVSVPERKLKFAGTENEPWEKFKKPPEPPRNIKPERPEDYYMRPTSYGSPRYTGD